MRKSCVLLSLTAAVAVAAPVSVSAQWPSSPSGPGQVQWPDTPRAQSTTPQSTPKTRPPARAQAQQRDVEELTPGQIRRAQEMEPLPNAPRSVPKSAPTAVKAKPKGPVVRVVACSGAFAKNSSHIRLAQIFGSQNLAFTEVAGPEDSKLMASVLYPRDPRQRLEVLWENEAARSDTQFIVINGKSAWNGPRGAKIGLDIAALQRANGKPFKIGNFDNDGATIRDWQGGAFSSLPGGCKMNVRLVFDSKRTAATGCGPFPFRPIELL